MKASHVRRDIQGLRAVAVLAVVLDHLLGWPSGGFVGVDVFFVISGFLITGLLLREHERTGRISFAGFYRRRIKRILPAATLVLVVTVAASFLLFATSRATGTLIDAIWAFFFSANWRFASIGTDYFAGAGPVSPLQHYWSLSVEEQFYFVWPWLMLLVLWLGMRRPGWDHHRARRAAGLLLIAITAASFGWALLETLSNPTVAYFSTVSRTWELGVGALAAIYSPLLSRIPQTLRPLFAWSGLVGIAISLFVVSETNAFPAPWAGLPVVATALVLVANIGGDQRGLWLLTNRGSTYVGDISFSLYLWHFPVIILGAALVPMEGMFLLGAVLVMAALSIGSYHFVEDPIRKSLWLTGASAERRHVAKRSRRERLEARMATPTARYGSLAIVVLVNVGLLAYATVRTPSTPEFTPPAAIAGDSSTAVTAGDELSSRITSALQADEWPELSPDIRNLDRSFGAPEWVVDGCLGSEAKSLGNPQENARRCVYGDPNAENQAVVIGDSIAISWLPAIRAALNDGWAIHVWTMQQCPYADVSVVKADGSNHADCDSFRDWTMSELGVLRPDLVIASTATNTVSRLVTQAEGVEAHQQIVDGTEASLTSIAASTSRVVVLSAPPTAKNPQECVTALGSPGDCMSRVPSGHDLYAKLEKQAVDALGNPSVTYKATRSWTCNSAGACPAFIGTTPVTADGGHLTGAFSATLGPVLREVLLPTAEEETPAPAA